MLKDQVEHHFTLQPLTMANIQQSEQSGTGTDTNLHTLMGEAMVLIHVFKDQVEHQVEHHLTLQPLTMANIQQSNREVPVLVYTQ